MAAMPVEAFADTFLADQSLVLCIVSLVTKDLLYQLQVFYYVVNGQNSKTSKTNQATHRGRGVDAFCLQAIQWFTKVTIQTMFIDLMLFTQIRKFAKELPYQQFLSSFCWIGFYAVLSKDTAQQATTKVMPDIFNYLS